MIFLRLSPCIGATGLEEVLQLAHIPTTLCPWRADWWCGHRQGAFSRLSCVYIVLDLYTWQELKEAGELEDALK